MQMGRFGKTDIMLCRVANLPDALKGQHNFLKSADKGLVRTSNNFAKFIVPKENHQYLSPFFRPKGQATLTIQINGVAMCGSHFRPHLVVSIAPLKTGWAPYHTQFHDRPCTSIFLPHER